MANGASSGQLAAVVLLVAGAAGAAPAVDEVSPLLRPIAAGHEQVPALFGAIIDHGKLTALGAVGSRKTGDPTVATSADLVHLGSDTKGMTAVLIGQLVRRHQLAWSDTMAELFPELRPTMDPAMAAVTVAQLMHHTASLPHDLPWGWCEPGALLPAQRLAAVRLALSAKPARPPGQEFAYSNVGYVLLGAIVERKTGRPWEQVVTDELFKPLGMASAGFGPPGAAGEVDQPWGHREVNGRLVPSQSDNPPVMGPAGRVHCTMADWGKFVSLFCGGDPATVGLDAAMVDELTTPAAGERYAGGWIVTSRPWAGGRTLTHVGSNTVWTCATWVSPGRQFAVLAAANAGGADAAQACDEVAAALIRRHAGGGR